MCHNIMTEATYMLDQFINILEMAIAFLLTVYLIRCADCIAYHIHYYYYEDNTDGEEFNSDAT